MLELEQARQRLLAVREEFIKLGDSLDIPGCLLRIEELEDQMNAPEFWSDLEKSQKINQELKALKNKVNKYNGFKTRLEDTEVLAQLGLEMQDLSVKDEVLSWVDKLEKDLEAMQLETLLKGPYDSNNAIISLHAGAGGTESMDWVSMLLRMYTRWCEKKGYEVKTLDFLAGEEAGVKSVTLHVIGENAYGYLKAEKGVHRLVRISPFDASGRRHTSFASVDVMPELDDDITIEIRPEDIRVDVFRSSGAGGQHVNKTESAVRITHLETGIVVTCQNERSQIQNRETAMKMLKAKLLELKEREAQEKISDLKGEMKKIEWGSQIRSYVFHPYNMVKDHRTNCETGNVQAVMDGDLDMFIHSYLTMS
ncbi:MAG TPA: peptide chain release factor 2 [Candidatus Atribacteria bacterium]|nr:peptide chain release factor 2 [Candidatus Atribacteria bacterium]HPT79496.1 peptide chain release factor 2 [Candidatus Atribacteria bacterium]